MSQCNIRHNCASHRFLGPLWRASSGYQMCASGSGLQQAQFTHLQDQEPLRQPQEGAQPQALWQPKQEPLAWPWA